MSDIFSRLFAKLRWDASRLSGFIKRPFPSQPFFPWYWHLLFGEGGRSIKFGFVKICSLARVVGPSNLTSSNGRLFQLQSFPASMILTSGVTHSSRHIHPPPPLTKHAGSSKHTLHLIFSISVNTHKLHSASHIPPSRSMRREIEWSSR